MRLIKKLYEVASTTSAEDYPSSAETKAALHAADQVAATAREVSQVGSPTSAALLCHLMAAELNEVAMVALIGHLTLVVQQADQRAAEAMIQALRRLSKPLDV